MAEAIERSRTNYFRTPDEDGLRAFLQAAKAEACITFDEGPDGTVMFCCAGSILGAMTDGAKEKIKEDPDWADDNPDEAWSLDLFLDGLKRYVAPGDACVITTVGYEKLRSLWADAVIVTKDRVRNVSLRRAAMSAAREALGDPRWSTCMDG